MCVGRGTPSEAGNGEAELECQHWEAVTHLGVVLRAVKCSLLVWGAALRLLLDHKLGKCEVKRQGEERAPQVCLYRMRSTARAALQPAASRWPNELMKRRVNVESE